MHRRRSLLAAAVMAALALNFVAGVRPAGAAEGYHAAYFSESSFLSLAQGQTGQFAVGYGNTGDLPWVKGSALEQASLQTRNGSTQLFLAGWSSNWVAPNVYANQTNDLVAPGQVGFFIYNIKVPTNAPLGPQDFTGVEVLAGVPLEDYGYYQTVTVTGSTLVISGSSPASPSTTTTPVISGSGASPGVAITVQEGSTALCTATASATGTFSCTTSALSGGSHSISATGLNQGTSPVFTYVVDTAAPAIASVDTAQGLQRMNVCFNKTMSTTGSGSIVSITNYTLSGITLGTTVGTGQTINSIVASSDARCALFIFNGTTGLTNNSSYTLTVSGVKDSAGNTIAAGSTFAFTAADSGAPTGASITQPGTYEVVVSFNEAMDPTTLIAANFQWDSASFPGNLAIRSSGSGLNRQVRLTFTTVIASGTHSLDVRNVKDTAGNFISPNPTSFTVSIASELNRPSVSSAVASRGDYNLASTGGGAAYLQTVNVTFSEAMRRAADWGTTAAIDTTTNYTLTNPDGTSATTGCAGSGGTAITVVASPPLAMLADDSDARWELRGVRLVLSALMQSSCQYSLTIANVQDQAANALNPNPVLITVSDTADSATLAVQSAVAGSNSLQVCYSKSMFASVTTSTGGFQSNTTASNTANYSFTLGGAVTLSWTGSSGNNWNVTPDGRCITFTTGSTLASGTGSLTVSSVTDPGGLTISPNPSIITVTYADTSVPTLTGASYISGDSFSVTFSKAMSGGAGPANSAGNVINYSLNNSGFGNICGSGTAGITSSSNGTVWTLTCTATSGTAYLSNVNAPPTPPAAAGSGAYIVTVRNVADSNGNVISPNPQSRSY